MELTRRNFLATAGAAGALAVGATMMGCSPKNNASNEDAATAPDAQDASPAIDESLITNTVECEAIVVGLGIAGVAALRSAAESGLNVIGVEKCSVPSCRSNMIAAFNTDRTRALGIQDIDPTVIANELMIQMAHRADYRVVVKWLKNCGEAFEWYADAFEDLLWLGPEDAMPEDPETIYVYAESTAGDTYRFGIDHERLFAGCACIGGGSETHRPLLEANLKIAEELGAQTIFDSPAVQIDVSEGRATGIVCQNLQDESYTRYIASKGVILASGDYSFNDEMLKQYAPWIYANLDKYLRSHEGMDCKGGHASMGDGQRMGIAAGGHVDVGPHAVMAHILQFGVEQFLEVNERGQRFCNEDLSMTNISKIMMGQPGSKVFQIIDAKAEEYYPGLDAMLGYIRSYGDGETYSAEADSLEELAKQLGMQDEAITEFKASVERYNELCLKGADDDFGKAPEKMHAITEPPFRAITYDMYKHTSVDDVSCMRLLVTMGGLVTDDCARVLDDDLNPIPSLYAVGNVQGGRFVDDYPFSLSGASHAAALTYGYLAGKQVSQDN